MEGGTNATPEQHSPNAETAWRNKLEQQWALRSVKGTNGAYQLIVNRLTGAALEPSSNYLHKAVCPARQVSLSGKLEQQWERFVTPGGLATFVNRRTRQILQLRSERSNPEQKWRVVAVEMVGPPDDHPDVGEPILYTSRLPVDEQIGGD